MNITLNSEKNGIEIRFECKPEQYVIDTLKQNGFRWSGKQRMWFAKQTEERMRMVNRFYEEMNKAFPCGVGSVSFVETKTEQVKNEYSLWQMTRIENIGSNVDKGLSCKDIAAACRKHLRARFPMCKISVTSTYDSVSVTIVSSPFTKGSVELNAIAKYCGEYVESYKYCVVDDPYGDYGSTYNFYGGRSYTVVDYSYAQTTMTDEYKAMCEVFVKCQSDYEKAEEERAEKEYQAYLLQQAEAEMEAEKRQKKHNEEHEVIVGAAVVTNANYFVLNMREVRANKNSSLMEYEEQCDTEDGWKYTKCHVTRELRFSKSVYDLFINHLLDDFDFIAGMGSDKTTDYRINSILDYENMSQEEQSTVDWYCEDAIAVFCDDKMMFVIDAQGHSYARYVFLPDDETEVVDTYECKQVISKEQNDAYVEMAETLEDVSTDIIVNNDLLRTWHMTSYHVYKKHLIQWIREHNFAFNVNVVRAIANELLKTVLYRVLNECDSLKEQFENASLIADQKITMIRMSEFGGMVVSRVKFKGYTIGDYAQYSDSVRLVCRPEKKRNDYYKWLYGEVLIYDGWLEVPEELLWETIPSSTGLVCKKSRFLSCDKKQYEVIMNHFASVGKKPIINTIKPMF